MLASAVRRLGHVPVLDGGDGEDEHERDEGARHGEGLHRRVELQEDEKREVDVARPMVPFGARGASGAWRVARGAWRIKRRGSMPCRRAAAPTDQRAAGRGPNRRPNAHTLGRDCAWVRGARLVAAPVPAHACAPANNGAHEPCVCMLARTHTVCVHGGAWGGRRGGGCAAHGRHVLLKEVLGQESQQRVFPRRDAVVLAAAVVLAMLQRQGMFFVVEPYLTWCRRAVH